MNKSWSLGKKLFVAFASCSIITLALGIVGYYGANSNDQSIDTLSHRVLPAVEQLLTIQGDHASIDAIEKTLLSRDLSIVDRKQQYAEIYSISTRVEQNMADFEASAKSPEVERAWRSFNVAWANWQNNHDRLLDLARQFDTVDIQDPARLESNVYLFQRDHFQLEKRLSNLIEFDKQFSGGEVHNACNLGKWLQSFESTSPILQRLAAEIDPEHQTLHAHTARVKQLALTDPQQARDILHGPLEEASHNLLLLFDGMLAEARRAGELSEAFTAQALGDSTISFAAAHNALTEIVELQANEAEAVSAAATRGARFIKSVTVGAMIIGVLAAIGLGVLIGRGIQRTLQRVNQGLSKGSERVAASAAQVSDSGQSLAEGASEQAASLEETSASLEEVTSMTKRNSENAEQAKDLSTRTRAAADNGVADVEEMKHAMDAIKLSSNEIAKIVKTIDEIAFQTNILALNAAVEAARAGEAGMGFAVVAEEVRALAQRSAEAAKESATMIDDSVSKSERGVQISAKVAQSLTQIVEHAREVDNLVAEIATASHEQSEGISQVSTAISQMDQVTQSNAAHAEESAASANELNAQSAELRQVVQSLSVLITGGTSTEAPPPPRRPITPRFVESVQSHEVKPASLPNSPNDDAHFFDHESTTPTRT